MKSIIIFDHPYFDQSRVNKHLLNLAKDNPEVIIRNISSLYIGSDGKLTPIDVKKEQEILVQYDRIILQFPFFWYSTPFPLKRWLDEVLSYNFAYGPEGDKLKDKEVLFSITTGGAKGDYSETGYNNFPVEQFIFPLIQTMNLCRMKILKPFFIQGVNDKSVNGKLSDERLEKEGKEYANYITSKATKYIGQYK